MSAARHDQKKPPRPQKTAEAPESKTLEREAGDDL